MVDLRYLLLVTAATAATATTRPSNSSLPIIDLGTSVHQAQLNATGQFYTFKNIPYAEPPIGNLRFRAPLPRVTVNRTVDDGSNPRICPQASQDWFALSFPLIIEALEAAGRQPPALAASAPQVISEDCLLLDVTVPQALFDAQASGKLIGLAPVMLWIHGGAYTSGSKDGFNPAGIIAESRANGEPGVIYVGINYRLGLFGFPPRQPGMVDIASNAGLYDQRLAMDWVLANIHRFGGDPSAVTVFGESAGAGSIVSHLSAYGGVTGSSPFKRAIIQSPAIKPAQDAALYSQLYKGLLQATNATSYAQIRQLSSADLQAVNTAIIGAAPFASSVYGPNIDGVYIPAAPGLLLTQSRVDRAVQVIVAHNLNEGLLFTDPRVSNQSSFEAFLQGLMPSLPSSQVTYLATEVYPPPPENNTTTTTTQNLPYTTYLDRTTLAISEALIDCFAFGVALAYANQTRGYQFSIFPAIHALDVGYTFWAGEATDSLGGPIVVPDAQAMQAWFVEFARTGKVDALPVYGTGASVVNVTETGLPVVRDPTANGRCRFWLEGLTV